MKLIEKVSKNRDVGLDTRTSPKSLMGLHTWGIKEKKCFFSHSPIFSDVLCDINEKYNV